MNRRTLFQSAAAIVASAFAGKWLVDNLSSPGDLPAAAAGGHFIDVREFKRTTTVEQLAETAEGYFARLKNWDYALAKPLWDAEGAPELLNNFAHALHGLQLLPGMTVVDFGAGSCWASRWLTQMGMEAIALDVSPSALNIGRALYERLPVIGNRPQPRFLVFDGRRIGLPDASVDRILCIDAFHHVLNQDEVLREMSRILKPGGIAGFSEPGPQHSMSPGSQFEMRNFRVLEDDIRIDEIWSFARQAGFRRIKLAVFNSPTYTVLSPSDFEDYLSGGEAAEQFGRVTRLQMRGRRVFFLQKSGEPPALDSRGRVGLRATLEVSLATTKVKQGDPLTAQVTVTNSGRAIWLPGTSKMGGVLLTCNLLDTSGKMLLQDYSRHLLTPGDGRAIAPGESVKIELRIPPPAKGQYLLEFDLVSESVTFFSALGSETVQLAIQVV